jgi:putative aldouronate transport system substrate-binding protein
MKLTKRFSFFGLALLLAAGFVFAGGGQQQSAGGGAVQTTIVDGKEMAGNTFVTGLPIVKDPLTLKVVVAWHVNDEWVNSYDKKPFVSKAEKETGIKIEWSTPEATQIPAILASNDLPDVFLGTISDNLVVMNPSLFVPVTDDIMKKYLPHVLDLYEKNLPDWRRFLTYPDGKIYGLMGGYYTSYLHLTDSVTWINTTWLKNVGKNMPTTTEEFYDVLKAFKEKDANGNGNANDEIPLDFASKAWAGGIEFLAGSWGIWGNFNLKNGKVSASVNTPEYRAYLEFFHRLVAEGLVNVEGFSQTTEQYYANIRSMKDGVFLGWAPPTFMSDGASILQYAPLPILAAPGKENLRIAYSGSKKKIQATRNAFVVTKSSKNPEAAFRWWDYLSTDQDMAMFVNWGEEGIGYKKLGENKYQVTDVPQGTLTKLGLSSPTAVKASMGLINIHPLVLNNLSVDVVANPILSDACRQNGIDAVYKYINDDNMPQSIVPDAQSETRTLIEADLLPLIAQFRAEAIVNGITDAKWNAYVKQLEDFRYSEYIKWNQDFYDGKFAK